MDLVERQRTKHVEIHMHYIRDLVHDKTIILQNYPIDEQIEDIFTNNFTKRNFTYLHSLLGVSSSGWSITSSVFILRGFFPTRFSLFPHLAFYLRILELLYCTGWPIVFVFGALEFHAFYFTPPKYSLRGGVGVIIQPTHLFGQFWPN